MNCMLSEIPFCLQTLGLKIKQLIGNEWDAGSYNSVLSWADWH